MIIDRFIIIVTGLVGLLVVFGLVMGV